MQAQEQAVVALVQPDEPRPPEWPVAQVEGGARVSLGQPPQLGCALGRWPLAQVCDRQLNWARRGDHLVEYAGLVCERRAQGGVSLCESSQGDAQGGLVRFAGEA